MTQTQQLPDADRIPGKRILLVDDDQAILDSMRETLSARGYEVLVGRDGEQGMKLARESRPDLVVLDMMMPRRSGYSVLERIRRDDPLPTRVIMITANESIRHRQYAERLGVNDYLRKPFSMDQLLERIEVQLS